MAKKAKGAAASPSVPDPKPNPIVEQKPKKKRCCYFCQRAEAKNLHATHLGVEPVYFCSLYCAAAWAIGRLSDFRVTWCEKHCEWSTPKGTCLRCMMEGQGYPNLLGHPDAAEIAGTEGVSNG